MGTVWQCPSVTAMRLKEPLDAISWVSNTHSQLLQMGDVSGWGISWPQMQNQSLKELVSPSESDLSPALSAYTRCIEYPDRARPCSVQEAAGLFQSFKQREGFKNEAERLPKGGARLELKSSPNVLEDVGGGGSVLRFHDAPGRCTAHTWGLPLCNSCSYFYCGFGSQARLHLAFYNCCMPIAVRPTPPFPKGSSEVGTCGIVHSLGKDMLHLFMLQNIT